MDLLLIIHEDEEATRLLVFTILFLWRRGSPIEMDDQFVRWPNKPLNELPQGATLASFFSKC